MKQTGVLTACVVSLIDFSKDDTEDPQNTILFPQPTQSQ